MLLKLIQGIIDGLVWLLEKIVVILPASPFSAFYEFALDKKWLGMLAYIVPVPQIISLLTAWGVAIGLFYLYSTALRWAKAIE